MICRKYRSPSPWKHALVSSKWAWLSCLLNLIKAIASTSQQPAKNQASVSKTFQPLYPSELTQISKTSHPVLNRYSTKCANTNSKYSVSTSFPADSNKLHLYQITTRPYFRNLNNTSPRRTNNAIPSSLLSNVVIWAKFTRYPIRDNTYCCWKMMWTAMDMHLGFSLGFSPRRQGVRSFISST